MPATGQSWSTVVQNILSNVQEIVASQIRLAQAEVKEEALKTAKASFSLVFGALLGLYALGFLFLCFVYALGLVLASWLAALLVGVFLAVGALILIAAGREKLKTVHEPVQTIESVEETVEWAKNQST